MSQLDRVDGGVHTARVSAAVADRLYREQRQADARRYLLRRGLDDVAEILGLTTPAAAPVAPPAEVARPKKSTSSSGQGRQRKGCPSEAQHRRHRERGEECSECSALMRRVNVERKRRAKQRRAAV